MPAGHCSRLRIPVICGPKASRVRSCPLNGGRGFMALRVQAAGVLTAATIALVIAGGVNASPAAAHSHPCHTQHTCPSDHHTYVWFDSNGTGWSCARLGGDGYNPALDTTVINYGGRTYYCRSAGVSLPPPPPLPTLPEPPPVETEEPPVEPKPKPKPPPPPAYVGTLGYSLFAAPTQDRPLRLHPFSGDNGAYFYGLRWSSWGKGKARARGKASVNTCDPYCAAGKHVRRRGARAVAYRLRKGRCDGEPSRFYTRVLMRFPKTYEIAAMRATRRGSPTAR
jgi:hypothetical protein